MGHAWPHHCHSRWALLPSPFRLRIPRSDPFHTHKTSRVLSKSILTIPTCTCIPTGQPSVCPQWHRSPLKTSPQSTRKSHTNRIWHRKGFLGCIYMGWSPSWWFQHDLVSEPNVEAAYHGSSTSGTMITPRQAKWSVRVHLWSPICHTTSSLTMLTQHTCMSTTTHCLPRSTMMETDPEHLLCPSPAGPVPAVFLITTPLPSIPPFPGCAPSPIAHHTHGSAWLHTIYGGLASQRRGASSSPNPKIHQTWV